jgi:hypothetical protein
MKTQGENIMDQNKSPVGLTRRELLARSTAAGASFVIGAGFLASPNAAWAIETAVLKPESMAALVQMARDIYPHDKVGDEYYVIALKGYDNESTSPAVEGGIEKLNARARAAGYENYVSVGWEEDRVAILRSIEEDAFFQQIRGGLVTGLYNQKEVWPIFGYEGASFEYGGYIDRGFNDINWL